LKIPNASTRQLKEKEKEKKTDDRSRKLGEIKDQSKNRVDEWKSHRTLPGVPDARL
jgi:hypothetical protein